MSELEALVALVLAAVILAAAARRLGAPYPAFLALGGVILAFIPGAPVFTVPPDIALALFVAPVLLDAATTRSISLKKNWTGSRWRTARGSVNREFGANQYLSIRF